MQLFLHGSIVSVQTKGETRQVIRNWPEDLEVGNHTIFDEKNEQYIKIANTKILQSHNTLEVEIDIPVDLVGNHSLMIKGRPVIVYAESAGDVQENIMIGGKNISIIQTTSSSNGDITEYVIPIKKSEIDSSTEKEIGAVAIREWKPKSERRLLTTEEM